MKNNKKYCFLAFGELALDIMYNDECVLKEMGGVSAFNVLYNLSIFGEETYAIGGVGNDINAIKAVNSLLESWANINYINFIPKATNVFYIYKPKRQLINHDEVEIKRESPITGQKTIKWSDKLNTKLPEKFKERNIILIVSNFEKVTNEFIKDAKNKSNDCIVSLDITNPKIFEQYSEKYLWDYLKNIDLLQCNKNTFKAFCEKMYIKSPEELFDKLNLKIFTITEGEDGATFLYKENNKIKKIQKKPEKIVSLVDPTGAGDAFHAMLLLSYNRILYSNDKISKDYFDKAFEVANCFARKIVQIDGARGNAEELLKYMLSNMREKIKKDENEKG